MAEQLRSSFLGNDGGPEKDAPEESNDAIKHSEIFELDDPAYWYGESEVTEEEDLYNDPPISKIRTQKYSTPTKTAMVQDKFAFTPPKRISSLPNSPTSVGGKRVDMETDKQMNETPVKAPKSVKFSEDIKNLEELPQSWDNLEAEYDPETTFVKGLSGTIILVIYLTLLLLSSFCSPLILLLASIRQLTENILFQIICVALKEDRFIAVSYLGMIVVSALAAGSWVVAAIVVFVVFWSGLLLWMGWWVLLVGLGLVEGSEVFVEHWVLGGKDCSDEGGRWRYSVPLK